jgi:hypothetical protein
MVDALDLDVLEGEFYMQGFCKVPSAIPSGVCKTLPVRYIHQCHPPRSLTDRKAWPRENQTRVAESAPLGNCGFWEDLFAAPRLAAALDRCSSFPLAAMCELLFTIFVEL